MARCFVFKFPPNFPRAERETLTARLDANSFMPLPTYSDENQTEYLFADNTVNAESLRKRFEIPATVEITETTNWLH